MGKDNQDHYKVGGRSGGPAGPLRGFKQKLAQEQARTHRLEAGRLPHERRPAEARPQATVGEQEAWEGVEDNQHKESQPGEGSNPREPREGPSEGERLPLDSGPARGSAQEEVPEEETPTATITLEGSRSLPQHPASEADAPRGAKESKQRAELPPSSHFSTARQHQETRHFPPASAAGFGPPASEEIAVGDEQAPDPRPPSAKTPLLLREAARRFPLPFRWASQIERRFDRRLRAALEERPLLSGLEQRLGRPIGKSLEMLRFLGETAEESQRRTR